MSGRLIKKTFIRLFRWDPWKCMALLYALLTVGVVAVALFLQLALEDMILPVFLLLAGTVHAAYAQTLGHPPSLPSRHKVVPALLFALFIFAMSNRSFTGVHVPVDTNMFHPVEYAFFAVFLCWMFHHVLVDRGVAPFAARVLLIGCAYAVFDEIHQSFVPGRMPSFIDLALDLFGLCIGCGMYLGTLAANRYAVNNVQWMA